MLLVPLEAPKQIRAEVEIEGARPCEREPPPNTPPPTTRTPVSTPWLTVAPPPRTAVDTSPKPVALHLPEEAEDEELVDWGEAKD